MPDIKPQLAEDFDEDKIVFPVYALVKIDGVRGINLNGTMTGRSLKNHGNQFVTNKYSGQATVGFDGELALTGQETSHSLCRDTTSAVRRFEGQPKVTWWLFDFITEATLHLGYVDRLAALQKAVDAALAAGYEDLKIVPGKLLHSMEDLLRFETEALDAGYEGVIFRSPDGLHKNGRATVKGGTYMRIKRFIDFEGTIVGFTEAMENTNEAKTNELGRTERSTHQANMVPKGMIGNITLKALKDVKDPFTKQVLIAKDQEVLCGAGSMTHEDRIRFWNAPSLLVGQVGKAKFFPKGQKDKPRFPIYQGVRATEDMSE